MNLHVPRRAAHLAIVEARVEENRCVRLQRYSLGKALEIAP
jgi:hypothetical protein